MASNTVLSSRVAVAVHVSDLVGRLRVVGSTETVGYIPTFFQTRYMLTSPPFQARQITAAFTKEQPSGQQKLRCIKDILAFGAAESELVQAAMVEAWCVLIDDKIWQVC